MDHTLKAGVYLKSSGKLILLDRVDNSEGDWAKYTWRCLDGRKTSSYVAKFLHGGEAPYVAWECKNSKELYDAWGPTNFLYKCEYLSEL
jgi:hypothetical protein